MKLKAEWQGTRWPAGGWPFTDPRTGMKFDPNSGDIRHKVGVVIQHRKSNPHVYPPNEPQFLNAAYVATEIEEFICNQKPELCDDGVLPKPVFNKTELPDKICPDCGKNSWIANFCKTCGGAKVESYTCAECGKKI